MQRCLGVLGDIIEVVDLALGLVAKGHGQRRKQRFELAGDGPAASGFKALNLHGPAQGSCLQPAQGQGKGGYALGIGKASGQLQRLGFALKTSGFVEGIVFIPRKVQAAFFCAQGGLNAVVGSWLAIQVVEPRLSLNGRGVLPGAYPALGGGGRKAGRKSQSVGLKFFNAHAGAAQHG